MTPASNTDELFIINRMIEGDKLAFRYFFEKYYRELCNFVNLYLKDQVLAEEVVQDIFVYFWENKRRIKINTSVRAYLYGASKYKSLNVIRAGKSEQHLREELAGQGQYMEEIPFDQYSGVEEFRRILDEAILTLPEKCREIFLLSKQKDLTNKQIAEQLGVSVKTVENQITIALKKLRIFLEPYREKIFLIFLLYLFR